jgi:3-hydroxyacyl-CoA dehydrogenase
MVAVGQAPVMVRREIPGFILKRLQGALLDEAWSLFDQGFASVEDIDKTIKFGLGLRWSPRSIEGSAIKCPPVPTVNHIRPY